MARHDFPYRKLPGVRRGIFSGASLWLGKDHILHVKNTRFAEDYRRYYFTDIEAIYLQKTPRFLPPPAVVIAVILGLIAIVILSLSRRTAAVGGAWAGLLALSAYAAWLCLFRSCVCSIQTALGTDRLSCLHRISGARAAIEQITNQVLQTQGPPVEYVPFDEVQADEPPEAVQQPLRSRETLFGWLTLPFILLSSTLVSKLGVPIPERPFQRALGAILAAVILAVLALIQGRRDRFGALRGALLALTLICGLELYALVLVNTYSQPIHFAGSRQAVPFVLFARGAHVASVWLSGANMAAAVVTALLLFRNPSIRSNPKRNTP
jgi:hypothetical protein